MLPSLLILASQLLAGFQGPQAHAGFHSLPAPDLPSPSVNEASRVTVLRLAQWRQCSQRMGPFVTQTTAWDRQRQAQGMGYSVSGVFPCYDGSGYRGYCFNVFYAC